MPLIDSFINLLLQLLEVWKGNLVLKITKTSLEAEKLKKDFDEENLNANSNAIGFSIINEEEEDFDYEEDI